MRKWQLVVACSLSLVGAACGQSSTTRAEKPSIVVTHAILASVVQEVVGDRVDVRIIIPNGKDPHEYSPTPRDIEAISKADLIVRNGGEFDQSLDRVIKDAQRSGVPVFVALDSVVSPPAGTRGDPHFFTDPASMAQIIAPLAAMVAEATQVDVEDLARETLQRVNELTTHVSALRAKLSTNSADGSGAAGECVLITGHESLAYIAARNNCTVLGTVIPGLSSSAEASAADVARLKTLATENNVRAIFVESTMSSRVAVQLANELSIAVVPLDVEMLGDEGTYESYVIGLMTRIVEGLLGQ